MLTRRLQILIDDERSERLESEARRRHVSVAVLVREAIDVMYPPRVDARVDAARLLLGAEPMEVPGPDGLRRELDELRGRKA